MTAGVLSASNTQAAALTNPNAMGTEVRPGTEPASSLASFQASHDGATPSQARPPVPTETIYISITTGWMITWQDSVTSSGAAPSLQALPLQLRAERRVIGRGISRLNTKRDSSAKGIEWRPQAQRSSPKDPSSKY